MLMREFGKGETEKSGIGSPCTSHLVSCWPNTCKDIVFDLMELKLSNRIDNSNLNKQLYLNFDLNGFWWEKLGHQTKSKFFFTFWLTKNNAMFFERLCRYKFRYSQKHISWKSLCYLISSKDVNIMKYEFCSILLLFLESWQTSTCKSFTSKSF